MPIRYVEVAPKDDPGCADQKENRSSDLCAQWKAADAASDASRYAYTAIWVGLFGTILIVFTFWETRKTARLQLRAYVTHQVTDTNYFMKGNKLDQIEFVFSWKNSGATPALRVRNNLTRRWFPGSGLPHDFDFPDQLAVSPLKKGTSLGPGLIMVCPILVPIADLKLDEGGVTFFYGWVEYNDIYGNRRRTEFCFELKFIGDGRVAGTQVRLPARGPFNGMDQHCFRGPVT